MAKITGTIFALHYKVTAFGLLIFAAIVFYSQITGGKIKCREPQPPSTSVQPPEFLNELCYATLTQTQPTALPSSSNNGLSSSSNGANSLEIQHQPPENLHFYEWAGFLLAFQALLFLIPYAFWSICEGGKVGRLTLNLQHKVSDERERRNLVHYLHESKGYHGWYAFKYFLSQLIAICNLLGNFVALHFIFGQRYLLLGVDYVIYMFNLAGGEPIDPLARIFPRLADCRTPTLNTICVLPLSALHEKIFLILWYWFGLLALISILDFLGQLFTLCISWLRYAKLRLHFHDEETQRGIKYLVMNNVTAADWILLRLIQQNLDDFTFKEIMEEWGEEEGTKYETMVKTIRDRTSNRTATANTNNFDDPEGSPVSKLRKIRFEDPES